MHEDSSSKFWTILLRSIVFKWHKLMSIPNRKFLARHWTNSKIMQRATNRVNFASTTLMKKALECNFQNEDTGWSCCSEESGFADEEYRKVTKRRRGTSVVHISHNPNLSTDEETARSLSQDEHSQISDGCDNEVPQSLESLHETNKSSISESSDEMYQKITMNISLLF
jgi:hypothetical protein